ncbi:MAG: hypothetical protein VB835_15575 [Pirellulales bacterium]
MANKQVHAEPAKPTATAAKQQGKWYFFCVLTAAVFVVIVALGREKAKKFKATAVLLEIARQDSQELGSLESLREEIASPALIGEAVEELFPAASAVDPAPGLAAVRRSLLVAGSTDATRRRTTVSVSYRGSNAAHAKRIVNKICELFARQEKAGAVGGQPVGQNQTAASESAKLQAEQNLLAARQQLAAFDREESDVVTARERALHSSPVGEPPESQLDVEPTETEKKVLQLESEIASRNQQLNALLGTMTREHPLVKTILDEISALESQLSGVRPRVVHGANEEAAAESPEQLALEGSHLEDIVATEPARAPSTGGPALNSQERGRLRGELKQNVRDAEQEVQLLKSKERQQWEKQFSIQSTPGWKVEPATMAQRVYAPTNPSLLVFAMVSGLIAGGGLLIAGTGPLTISSPIVAEAALSVPVVGKVLEPPGHRLDQPKRPAAVRVLILCAETTIFVFLGAMILAVLSDKQFASQLYVDPLSALADGVRHILDFARR